MRSRSTKSLKNSARTWAETAFLVLCLLTSPSSFVWAAAPTARLGPSAHKLPAGAHVPGRLIIKFRSNPSPSELQRLYDSVHGREHQSLEKLAMRVIEIPDEAMDSTIQKLQQEPSVEYVEPDFLLESDLIPNDPSFANAWHLRTIHAPETWDLTTGSPAITVAILDSGILSSHPDLQPLLVGGWNFYDNNSDVTDVSGHGTGVAGCVSAVTNNGADIASLNWTTKLMPLRITDINGYGSSSAIASALNYAADHGARIANISYGSVTKITAINTAADYFRSKGGLITASAGNEGTVDSTADNPRFIMVSATDDTDTITSWSNTGNNIDIAAPGFNVVTTSSLGGTAYGSGTSFSAPVVAGVLALILSTNLALTNTQVENYLKQGADDLGTPGWDAQYGVGRVNALKSVNLAKGITLHPADRNGDHVISIGEMTGYCASKTTGSLWPTGPNPIPQSYSDSLTTLWKSGEIYHFDSGLTCPACWVSGQ